MASSGTTGHLQIPQDTSFSRKERTMTIHVSRQPEPLLDLSFTERHPALAVILTLLGLVILGVTMGEGLGRVIAQLLDLALSQVGAQG
jgi:uncharacterized membrane protein